MFVSDSDFEVDEEFLGTVLSSEHCRNNNDSKKNHDKQSRTNFFQNLMESNVGCTSGFNNLVKGVSSEVKYSEGFTESNSTDFLVLSDKKGSLIESKSNNTSNLNRTVERKFPGPAGLLPDKGNPVPDDVSSPQVTSPFTDDTSCKKQLITYQAWQSMLKNETWKKLLIDLKNVSSDIELCKIININSIKQKASVRLLVNKKIPFLAVILQDLSSSSPDPYITLCDPTGIMNGTLHRDVWKQYGEELVTGCVLLLKNISVFSIGVKSYKNQHYLNITSNNLVSLYASLGGRVRVKNIRQYTHEEIVRSIEEWNANTIQSLVPDQLSNETPQPLFSSPLISNKSSARSNPESSFRGSPKRQNPVMISTSTPLSTKNIKMNSISSNINSPSSSKQHFHDSRVTSYPPFLTREDAEKVSYTSDFLGKKQPLLRDSSSILNLISGENINPHCKRSSVKGPVNKQKQFLGNATNSNCIYKKRDVLIPSESCEKNSSNHYYQKNNGKSKLSKFFFKHQNPGDIENSNQDAILLKNESNSVEKLHLNKDSDNISYRGLNNNIKSFNFETKKPHTQSEGFFNIVEEKCFIRSKNCDKFLDVSISNEMQTTYGQVNHDVNRIASKNSTEKINFEQMQVDSILEGLDASSFMDDDF